MTHRWLDIHKRCLARPKTGTIGRMENPYRWHDPKEEVVPQDLLYWTIYRYQRFRVRVTEWDIVYFRPQFCLPYVESEVFLSVCARIRSHGRRVLRHVLIELFERRVSHQYGDMITPGKVHSLSRLKRRFHRSRLEVEIEGLGQKSATIRTTSARN